VPESRNPKIQKSQIFFQHAKIEPL